MEAHVLEVVVGDVGQYNPPAPLGATRLRRQGCVTGREEAVVVSVMRVSMVSVPVVVSRVPVMRIIENTVRVRGG